MVIAITSKCSLGCPHCLFDCKSNGVHMTFKTLEAALTFFKQSGSKHLQISGGEPTEHPQFFAFLNRILKIRKVEISLLTNGKFLHDPAFTHRLGKIHRKNKFHIQVSAMKYVYPNAAETVRMVKENAAQFDVWRIAYVEQFTIMDQLGRAKGKDWSFLGKLYQRKAPTCFNLFNLAHAKAPNGQGYVFAEFKDIMLTLARNTTYNQCKPLIWPDGTIHTGETNICSTPGTVHDVSCADYLNFLRTNEPCGKCGIPIPMPLYS